MGIGTTAIRNTSVAKEANPNRPRFSAACWCRRSICSRALVPISVWTRGFLLYVAPWHVGDPGVFGRIGAREGRSRCLQNACLLPTLDHRERPGAPIRHIGQSQRLWTKLPAPKPLLTALWGEPWPKMNLSHRNPQTVPWTQKTSPSDWYCQRLTGICPPCLFAPSAKPCCWTRTPFRRPRCPNWRSVLTQTELHSGNTWDIQCDVDLTLCPSEVHQPHGSLPAPSPRGRHIRWTPSQTPSSMISEMGSGCGP